MVQPKPVSIEGAINAIETYRRIDRLLAKKNNRLKEYRDKWSVMTDSGGDLWLR